MIDQNKPESSSFGKELGEELKKEAGAWLKSLIMGAVLGAIILGSLGFYLLGTTGLLGGLAVGAVVGGVGLWLLYLNMNSL
ncbi:MAG: hypothetical protein QGF46_05750 [Planctomycetota bacterium]|jgi:hypothetical protein|nr:hypothetical protein [Planctomycetota bacterium]